MADTITMDGLGEYLQSITEDFKSLPYPDFMGGLAADSIRDRVQENFDKEQRADGTAWAPLAASTIARKGSDTILVDKGKLKPASTSKSAANHIEYTDNSDDNYWLVFGESTEYGGFHMTGTSRMPARPHMEINTDTVDEMANSLADWIVDGIRSK